MIDPFPSSYPHVKSGRLKALAVTSPHRFAGLPDVPTMGEAGYPQIGSTSWYGALAPAKTPAPLIRKLHDEFVAVLAMPDLRESLVNGGADVVGGTPQQFAAHIGGMIAKYRRVV